MRSAFDTVLFSAGRELASENLRDLQGPPTKLPRIRTGTLLVRSDEGLCVCVCVCVRHHVEDRVEDNQETTHSHVTCIHTSLFYLS